MSENTQEQKALTFNDDGTIDPAQLVGLPQELIDRVTDPEFIARAKEGIEREKRLASFRRGAQQIKAAARQAHELRRPNGISGRQRKQLRRVARRAVRALSGAAQQGGQEAAPA